MDLTKKKKKSEEISVLINVMGGIFSPYSHVSNHHDIHLKYLTTLFVNYTSIKLGGGMHERRKHPSESSNKTGEWKYVYTHTHTRIGGSEDPSQSVHGPPGVQSP